MPEMGKRIGATVGFIGHDTSCPGRQKAAPQWMITYIVLHIHAGRLLQEVVAHPSRDRQHRLNLINESLRTQLQNHALKPAGNLVEAGLL